MKRTVLLLLACLLLALPTVAQAPEKAALDDLVVTAEIVGYSHEPGYKDNFKGVEFDVPSSIHLYAKMTIRNTTGHPREINMLKCGWYGSWITQFTQGGFVPMSIAGCDSNYPIAVTIPVGEAIVFNCPLLWIHACVKNKIEAGAAVSFNLGFADLSFDDVGHFDSIDDIKQVIKHARGIYWSNTLNSEIDLAAMKEVAQPYPTYHLTWDDK